MTHTKVAADEIVIPSPGDNDPRTSIVITIDGKVVAHVFVGQFSTSVSKGIFTKDVELEAKEITIQCLTYDGPYGKIRYTKHTRKENYELQF